MRKLSIWLIIAVFAVAMTLTGIGCKEEAVEEVMEEEFAFDELTIGYVMPYLEGWFYYWDVGWNVIMDYYGVETTTILTYWEAEAELQAVRDFITLGVDAISLESANPDTASIAVKEANAAGIPIMIDSASLASGGDVYLDISFDYGAIGKLGGEKIAELWPGSKVIHLAGIAGFLPTDAQDDALYATAEETGGYEMVGTEYTQYSMETALNTMRDIVQSGKEFDVVFATTQEAGEATIEAFKQAGILGEKIVLSVNYGPLDVENLAEGELDNCIGQSVGLHSMVAGAITLNHLQGIEPFSKVINMPFQWLTQENHAAEGIPWDVDDSWIPVAEKYAETGVLEY